MDGKTYPYLALAALAPVGVTLLDPRAAFVFASDGTRLLFANAAALALFDAESIGQLLARRFSDLNPIKGQAARLSRLLPTETVRVEMLRLGQGVRFATVAASCRRLNLAGDARAVLAVAATEATAESLTARAERLVDALGADDCLAALLNGEGKVLAASGGYDALAPAEQAIDRLAAAALASADRIVTQPIAVPGGERPAGAVRFRTDARDLVLLVVGPREGLRAAEPPKPAVAFPIKELLPPQENDTAGLEVPVEMLLPEDDAVPTAPEPTGQLVRFVFEMDGEGRFTFVSAELAATVGQSNGALAGWLWADIAGRLGAAAQEVTLAVAAGKSFSATLEWPAGDGGELPVELTGIVMPKRAGFRGFGAIAVDQRSAADTLSLGLDVAAAAEAPATRDAETAASTAATPAIPALGASPAADDLDVAAQVSIERGSALPDSTPAAPASEPGEGLADVRAVEHRAAARRAGRAHASGTANRDGARCLPPHRRGARQAARGTGGGRRGSAGGARAA